jgi:hypothetical protein
MAEKRSWLKIRDDGLREMLTDFRRYIAFAELTALCVRDSGEICGQFVRTWRISDKPKHSTSIDDFTLVQPLAE